MLTTMVLLVPEGFPVKDATNLAEAAEANGLDLQWRTDLEALVTGKSALVSAFCACANMTYGLRYRQAGYMHGRAVELEWH